MNEALPIVDPAIGRAQLIADAMYVGGWAVVAAGAVLLLVVLLIGLKK